LTTTTHAPIADFTALGVPQPVVRALEAASITTPFPIQAATLPDSLAGRDLLGRGRTGSGKTVAFAVPMVVRLAGASALAAQPSAGRRSPVSRSQPRRPRGLVLVPTRELATQVAAALAPLARALGLRVTTIFGGVNQNPQVRALRDGVDIVVACPGRLEDLIEQRHCELDLVEVTVLDEADHMADLGFLKPIMRILDRTPKGGQRLLFSATLDGAVQVLVRRYLDHPAEHSVDPIDEVPVEMTHHLLTVSSGDKAGVVRELASGHGRSLLFTRTKRGANQLAVRLSNQGVPAVALHGNLAQNARTRNLAAFADGSARVLVATDIAARGIHVDDISLVVHVDPPAEHKAYTHRSGRTARGRASGIVATVVTAEQRPEVLALTRKAGIKPTATTVVPGHPLLLELAGGRSTGSGRPVDAGGGSPLTVAPIEAPAPVVAVRSAEPRRAPAAGRGEHRRSEPATRPSGTGARRRRGGRRPAANSTANGRAPAR
jgi:superfamily II DNA/RNA helicase